MASLERIRTQGFRRWYERQLIGSHAWLVSCFLGILATASGIEILTAARLPGVTLLIVGAGLSVHSWRCYRSMLSLAERLAERAACPQCGAYGQFAVTAAQPQPLPSGSDPQLEDLDAALRIDVECRRCQQRWRLCGPTRS